jgi:hypothetical protein
MLQHLSMPVPTGTTPGQPPVVDRFGPRKMEIDDVEQTIEFLDNYWGGRESEHSACLVIRGEIPRKLIFHSAARWTRLSHTNVILYPYSENVVMRDSDPKRRNRIAYSLSLSSTQAASIQNVMRMVPQLKIAYGFDSGHVRAAPRSNQILTLTPSGCTLW